MTADVFLPASIPETLPADETQILSFIYQNGYTLKTDSGLAKIGNTQGGRVAELVKKWEKKGWVHVRRCQYTNGKIVRWICSAM